MDTTVILFSVKVPVLSVHNTVVAPSDSMAEVRRVSTRTLDMRHAPIAMNTAIIIGNSAGNIDIPNAMPPSSASSHDPRSTQNNPTVKILATKPISAKLRTKPLNCLFNCGCCVSIVCNECPILPISLRKPVAFTTATAVPRTTNDPAKIVPAKIGDKSSLALA